MSQQFRHGFWDLLRAGSRLLGLVIFLASAALVFAQSQSTTGTIQGTVTDPSGAVVPNATVTIRSTNTGLERTIRSDSEGRFKAPLLEPGKYDVTVSASGFATLVSRGYNLALGQTLVADQSLRVAGQSQSLLSLKISSPRLKPLFALAAPKPQ